MQILRWLPWRTLASTWSNTHAPLERQLMRRWQLPLCVLLITHHAWLRLNQMRSCTISQLSYPMRAYSHDCHRRLWRGHSQRTPRCCWEYLAISHTISQDCSRESAILLQLGKVRVHRSALVAAKEGEIYVMWGDNRMIHATTTAEIKIDTTEHTID